jgi:DNA-binding transcriptional regulator YiaG
MTSKQLRAALKKLGMKHDQYASLIGLSPRTLRHYLNPAMTGVTNVPAAILTTLLVQQKITPDDIERIRTR